MDFFLQLAVILACLLYGARKGGIALGLLGGIGLMITVFGFHLQPGKPPVDVMLVIIAVVAASATLQASGGLDVMLQIAERMLRRNPRYVSIIAPFVTCILTILCGTGHVVYTILPIIYDVAIKNNIRPERPMAASSIGAQMGIIASPVSVAVVSLVAMLSSYTFNGRHLEFLDLLSITIPSTLCGILAIGIFSWFRGKDPTKTRVPEIHLSAGKPSLCLWRCRHLTGSGAATQQLDRHVDFPRHHRTGGGAGGVFRSAAQLRRQTALHGPRDPDVHADGRGIDRHHYPHQPGVYL